MHHTNLWNTKLFLSDWRFALYLHFPYLLFFHHCRFVLAFSIHAFSIFAKCAVSYLPFPYLRFPTNCNILVKLKINLIKMLVKVKYWYWQYMYAYLLTIPHCVRLTCKNKNRLTFFYFNIGSKGRHIYTSQNLWSRYVSHFVGITWHNVWS